MNQPKPRPSIPASAWQRPIGQGWEQPYTARYQSNLDDGPWHGMPLGGFGAGCIGRSPKGDFNLWHLYTAEHVFKSIPACQFSIFEQPEAGPAQAYAMATDPPADGSLSRWQWYPKQKGQYHALYPRSWNTYSGVFQTELTCTQFSPIWPHCYQETSYPVAVFEWTAHNPTDQPITLSIMFTWQNIIGWCSNAITNPKITVRDDGSPEYEYQPRWGDSTGNFNQWIVDNYRVGCLFDRIRMNDDQVQPGEGQMCIASLANTALEAFYNTRWNPQSDGGQVWDSFAHNGSLCDHQDETPAEPGEQIAGAIAIRFTVRPGRTRVVPFVLAWDFPVLEFAPDITYYRRYTDFFGRSGKGAWTMIRTAFKHSDQWQEEITNWQQPILDRSDLPDWFKMALFNELYLLSQGGVIWSAADERDPVGQFGVLECLDYRWYESLDVRLYGGFALLWLFPKLEKAILEAYIRAIPASDSTPRIVGYNQAQAIRKAANATPHDLGAPNEHPWEKTNYTSYQDCNLWKDLGCDFVLQAYRYYFHTGCTDVDFLQESWPAITTTIAYLKEFDLDGDTIPENSGAPDQTFDDWRLVGISSYCGGLWLAALEAAIAIGQILQNHDPNPEIARAIATYTTWLDQGKTLYNQTLWNGQYYRLDTGGGSDIVMADQLCGQFYARFLGLPDIVPAERINSCLDSIYTACFRNFHNGKLGAANGLRPDGSPADPAATHPLEVWTGINFGLAAFFLQMGRRDQALEIVAAVVDQIYNNGLQFRTPEAITADRTFRAGHYLRALAIWGVWYYLK